VDGGQNWQEVHSLTPTSGFTSVALKPNDSNVVFTGSGYGVIKHYFEDDAWQSQYYIIADCRLAADVSFASQDPEVLYAVWQAPVAWGGDGLPKISKSADGGASWSTWMVDTATALLTVEVHPTDSATVFAGDSSFAVVKSVDSGEAWVRADTGINASTIWDVASDPADSAHLLAATQSGVYERTNPEAAWIRLTSERTSSVVFHPTDPMTYYAGITNYLKKTMDGGQTWTSSTLLDGFRYVPDIAVDPASEPNTLYIATQEASGIGGKIFKSVDNGDTFQEILAGENLDGDPVDFNAVAIDPSNRMHLFAGSGNFYNPYATGDLWESHNGGATWARTLLASVIVNDITINPDNPDIIYAGCGHSGGAEVPVYKSSDNGVTWTPTTLPGHSRCQKRMWSAPSGEIFIAGCRNPFWDYNIQYYDGSQWSVMETPPASDGLASIWGTASNDLFSVGDSGVILHFDGHTWTQMESHTTEDLVDVLGFSSTDVYAVSRNGSFLHYNGSQWSVTALPFNPERIWGLDADDLFAIGWNSGTIWHYDGASWSEMASGTTNDLDGIWGTSSTDIYAVGDEGIVLHFDGNDWSEMRRADTANNYLFSVWGSSPQDVYAAGNYATILHYDGSAWSAVDTGLDINTKEEYLDVRGTSSSDVYIVGREGTVLHYDGSRWSIHKKGGRLYNAATDLEFHRQNRDIVYAATSQAGVYISPNQGNDWLNLGEPEFSVNALSAGSLYAATKGGLYQCTGTGVIAGSVTESGTNLTLNEAIVVTDLGTRCFTIYGNYMMIAPAGIFSVFAQHDGYRIGSQSDVTVLGAEVSWVDFAMEIDDRVDPQGDIPTPVETPSNSEVNGGKYCFIGTLKENSDGALGAVYAGIVLWGLLGTLLVMFQPKAGKVVLVFVAISCMLNSTSRAATIFEQVGIASTPSPLGSGARAMGMGGAFIGVADDATAASWNPAGLIQLEKPEASIVGAYYYCAEDFSSAVHPEINNKDHVTDQNLNYFSLAFPFHLGKNMVVSLNYQRLFEFKRNFSYRYDYLDAGLDLDQRISFDQDGYLGALGIAGAVEITPRFSVGATLNIWSDELFWRNGWTENYHARSSGTESGVSVTIDTRIQDNYENYRGINANLGMLWSINDSLTFGAVFKTPFTATMTHKFNYDDVKTYGDPVNTTDPVSIATTEDMELSMPMSYGIGCAYRFSDTVSVDIDIYRTHWSDYILKNEQGETFSPIDGRPEDLSDVEETIHVRLGGEHLSVFHESQLVLSMRAGLFLDQEPSQSSTKDFYGVTFGTGISYIKFVFDLAYQYRWARDLDAGNLIATAKSDIDQHLLLCSFIIYL
jgi:long-subunit fatty acid transport protein